MFSFFARTKCSFYPYQMFFLLRPYYIREIKERYKKSLRKNGFAVCVPKREIFVCFSCPRRMTLTPFLKFQQYKTLSALQRLLYGLRIAFTGFLLKVCIPQTLAFYDKARGWCSPAVFLSAGVPVGRSKEKPSPASPAPFIKIFLCCIYLQLS